MELTDDANAKKEDDMMSAGINFADGIMLPNISFIIEKCNYFKTMAMIKGYNNFCFATALYDS